MFWYVSIKRWEDDVGGDDAFVLNIRKQRRKEDRHFSTRIGSPKDLETNGHPFVCEVGPADIR